MFEEVEEVVRGSVPGDLGVLHCQVRRYGIKVWFDADDPPREHYEAQVIGPREEPAAEVLAVEIGFHAEHRKAADNEAALAKLVAREPEWRRALGDDPVIGPFLGRSGHWRRISETWLDPDLDTASIDIALRLTDYIAALELHRR